MASKIQECITLTGKRALLRLRAYGRTRNGGGPKSSSKRYVACVYGEFGEVAKSKVDVQVGRGLA